MAIVATINAVEERHRWPQAGPCDTEADVMAQMKRRIDTSSREEKKEEQSSFVLLWTPFSSNLTS